MTTIPEKHKNLCKAIAKLCREHGLTDFSGTFIPRFDDDWNHSITFKWEAGRHGEDVGEIFIESTLRVWERIDSKEPRP